MSDNDVVRRVLQIRYQGVVWAVDAKINVQHLPVEIQETVATIARGTLPQPIIEISPEEDIEMLRPGTIRVAIAVAAISLVLWGGLFWLLA